MTNGLFAVEFLMLKEWFQWNETNDSDAGATESPPHIFILVCNEFDENTN